MTKLYSAKTPEDGVICLEVWPEGYVLWYHGEAVWKSWKTSRIAALAAQEKPEPGVAVKALEWIEDEHVDEGGGKYPRYRTKFPFIYTIVKHGSRFHCHHPVQGFSHDLAIAKAVVQAHHNNVIRSALVAPSPDLPEGDAVQTIAVPEGTRVIVKMGAACDMIIRHPKDDGRCPRSCNHRPDDFSMRDCIEAGECGCIAFPSPIDKGEVK